jgi:hypothetical protein
MRAFLRLKRKDQIILTDDEPRHSMNVKLQEELTKAAQKDQEKKKAQMLQQHKKVTPKINHFKLSEQLNNMDPNNEEEKSKMIEQLMELSINTKQTKEVNESNLYSGNKSGVRI